MEGDEFNWWDGDQYAVTCDLTKNSDYGYAWVEYVDVYYSTLEDGTNADLDTGVTEGGSGQNTPVNNLAATVDFWLAPLNASIAGTIYDVTTGRVATAATVALYAGSFGYDGYDGQLTFIGSTTTTTGAFSFANVMPGMSYGLMVTKAGYDYADFQPDKVSSSGDCGFIGISCPVGCNQALAAVDVNILYCPDKDVTLPYVARLDADDATDLWEDDEALDFQVDNFVLTFSEAMRTTHNIKNAVSVSGDFYLTVTSAGTNPTRDGVRSFEMIDDYTVSMTSAGVMTVALSYSDVAPYAAQIRTDLGWGVDVALAITAWDGEYQLELDDANYFLTDTSMNPWSDDLSGMPSGYQLSPNIWIQWGIFGGEDEDTFEIDAAF